jgi:hypothetical protein
VTAAAYLAAERPGEARRAIEYGLTTMHERGGRGYRAPLLRLEAEVLLAEGATTGARQRAEEALAVARELGTSPEIGSCHATLAKVMARLGDPTAAHEHLTTAQQTLEQLGLGFWASRSAGG